MQIKPERSAALTAVLLSAAGLAAGFVSGLLGAGGGIVVFFALTALSRYDARRKSPSNYEATALAEEEVRSNFVTTIAAILPMSAVSVLLYGDFAEPNYASVGRFLLSGIVGGVLGAFLLDRISTVWLKRIFAALVIYAGMNMMG